MGGDLRVRGNFPSRARLDSNLDSNLDSWRRYFLTATPIQAEQRPVEVRAAVAKEAPRGPLGANRLQIEGGGNDRAPVAGRLGHLGAGLIGDEGGAVERQRAAFALLPADTVAGDDGERIGHGMALHDPLPSVPAVRVGSWGSLPMAVG